MSGEFHSDLNFHKRNNFSVSETKFLFHFAVTVRQLERQLNAAGDLVGMRNDQHSSESEMSDMDDDDDESQVDIVSTPSQWCQNHISNKNKK